MVYEQAIAVSLIAVMIHLTTCDYAGLSFQLTRFDNDKFTNPTAKRCNWGKENEKFCKNTNSRCDGNCCQCTCDYQTSTFDRNIMKCRKNDEIRDGCKVKFINKYDGSQIQVLNLKKKGQIKLYWFVNFDIDVVRSFKIMNITYNHNGKDVKDKFLTENGTLNHPYNKRWETTIQWGNQVSQDYYGKLFKVYISYEIERKFRNGKYNVRKNDCFVFKSYGSITVTFPSRNSTLSPTTTSSTTIPSTPAKPSTMKPSKKNTSPTKQITTNKPTRRITTPLGNTTPSKKTTPTTYKTTGKTTDKVETPSPISETSPPAVSITTQIKESEETQKPTEPTVTTVKSSKKAPSLAARSEDGGNNAIAVPLAVVGCLVLLIAVVLVVLWSRRRSAKSSKEKNGGDGNRGVDNPVMMSHLENIYAEADNPVNSSEKGKNNVYDYAAANPEGDYTSLNMSKDEKKPTYQSLITAQSNLYEQIPANNNVKSSGASDMKGQAPIAEPLYHTVESSEGGKECGNIQGRTGEENPDNVYSVLEEKRAPENCGDEVSRRTRDDDPERVYSVLEDEDDESDYLKILPEPSDYEQPLDPPIPDI